MDNTAHKLTAETLINEVKTAHGSLDLLRVFLITGATDIGKSYDLIEKWYRHGESESDKAIFKDALKTLQEIELKRIELTSIIYGISPIIGVNADIVKEEPKDVTDTEEEKVILMLPTLDETLERVRKLLIEGKDNIDKASLQAFGELKNTVGQGKVMNSEKQVITWDDKQIDTFINSFIKINNISKKEDNFGFQTIYEHFTEMIKIGKTEDEIKESLKTLLVGKTIKENGGSTYLIKDETVFEDYYTRILANLIKVGIDSNKTTEQPIGSKKEAAEQKVEEEVAPFLAELDKDEKISSFASVAKKIKGIYTSFGLNFNLQASLDKAKELGQKYAPNLFARHTNANVSSKPIITPPAQTEDKIEIYDESHNIQESNKELWAEVEKYEYLEQIFSKAEELEKKGNWRDALSMTTILISSGKIKERKDSTEFLKWESEQIREWYENMFSPFKDKDKKDTIEDAKIVDEPATESATDPIQGPVPKAGSIEPKEQVSRLLKNPEQFSNHKFTTFEAPTSAHNKTSMSFQVLDVTEEESGLLITPSNMAKYFDGLRDTLVKERNKQPEIKKEIMETLSVYYEVSSSEAKRMAEGLVNEADAIRREVKRAEREAKKTAEEQSAENPQSQSAENAQENVNEVANSTSQDDQKATENTAGESSTSSNKTDVNFEGFENILRAKDKYGTHKAIYAKIKEFSSVKEGIEKVYEVIDAGRKHHAYKKSFLRNWKPTPPADLLGIIKKIVEKGDELSKAPVE